MNLKELSDEKLLERTEHWASQERYATGRLIEHLREVNRRNLYSDKKCGSLFKYCIKILRLSEASAQRRIDALRLTEVLPEIKEKMEVGRGN